MARYTHKNVGESLTQQHFAKDHEIGNMVEKYLKTGVTGVKSTPRQPIFGDFTSIDYQEMRNLIIDADNAFNNLPSKVRNRFHNDAYQLLRFCENPENKAEAIALGLVDPEPPKEKPVQPAEKPVQPAEKPVQPAEKPAEKPA
ncbi:MAG: internal scaffolding protein [Microvirus sp.]|nr:MAG: internal scaffolding protein [Microvirus sp.]